LDAAGVHGGLGTEALEVGWQILVPKHYSIQQDSFSTPLHPHKSTRCTGFMLSRYDAFT
jgi:hypothetical protein